MKDQDWIEYHQNLKAKYKVNFLTKGALLPKINEVWKSAWDAQSLSDRYTANTPNLRTYLKANGLILENSLGVPDSAISDMGKALGFLVVLLTIGVLAWLLSSANGFMSNVFGHRIVVDK